MHITHGSQISAANTGWQRTGITLTRVANNQSGPGWHTESGVFYITGDNVHIDGLDIPMPVRARGNDIQITRCRIASAQYYLIQASDIPIYYTGLIVEDCELYGLDQPSPPTIAVMACEDAIYRRCNIHGMGSSGPRLTNNNLMEECYIHSFAHVEPEHEAGTSANGPDVNITILRCKIMINSGGASCAIGIYLDFGTHNGIYITDNYLAGGAYVVQAGINVPGAIYPASQNVQITGNIFGRDYHWRSGIYGPVSQWRADPGCLLENNVWGGGAAATEDFITGTPIVLS